MSIVLLLLALTRTLHGYPVAPPPAGIPTATTTHVSALSALSPRDTQAHLGARGVNDIVISCVATIFACTWSAVHPNIPAPTDCWWTWFKRQVVTMIYALLAPEAVTAWALRQRLAARKIADEYNQEVATAPANVNAHSDHQTYPHSVLDNVRKLFRDSPIPPALKKGEVPRWTLTHGFLLQMGGFMLCEDGRPIQVLTIWNTSDEVNLIWNIQQGIIDAPRIPEEDIQDRSKGDAISKTLIILQTTWFIAQCVARWSTGLPVTELEVVTLGFALLNGITYALWWNKPQNIGRPMYLSKNPQIQSKKTRFPRKRPRSGNPKPAVEGQTPIPEAGQQPILEGQKVQLASVQSISSPIESTTTESEGNTIKKEPPNPSSVYHKKTWLRQSLQKDVKQHSSSAPWKLLGLMPLELVIALLRPLAKLAEYGGHDMQHYDNLRVPMFSSGFARDSEVFIPTAVIGALFGSVHLISSWFLQFSSAEEKWLWRVSAIVITVGPMLLGFWRYFYFSYWENILRTCMFIGVPLYVISRIIILVLSLVSLRNLPAAALQTIDWTTFIPHL